MHEVETTVNFCPRNPVLTWMLGGLNFQIEHHLFPRVPHTHYPKIAEIVRRNCAKHGVRYSSHPSLGRRCDRTSSTCGRWAAWACRQRSRWADEPTEVRVVEPAWLPGFPTTHKRNKPNEVGIVVAGIEGLRLNPGPAAVSRPLTSRGSALGRAGGGELMDDGFRRQLALQYAQERAVAAREKPKPSVRRGRPPPLRAVTLARSAGSLAAARDRRRSPKRGASSQPRTVSGTPARPSATRSRSSRPRSGSR